MYLDLAQALDEDLYVMMIVLFWQININQWTDRKLSETLLERLEQCEPHDGIWLHRKGTFLSALNRKAEALGLLQSGVKRFVSVYRMPCAPSRRSCASGLEAIRSR